MLLALKKLLLPDVVVVAETLLVLQPIMEKHSRIIYFSEHSKNNTIQGGPCTI